MGNSPTTPTKKPTKKQQEEQKKPDLSKPKGRAEMVMEFLTEHMVKDVALIILDYKGEFYFEGKLLHSFDSTRKHIHDPVGLATNDKHLFILDNQRKCVHVFDPVANRFLRKIGASPDEPAFDYDEPTPDTGLHLLQARSAKPAWELEDCRAKLPRTAGPPRMIGVSPHKSAPFALQTEEDAVADSSSSSSASSEPAEGVLQDPCGIHYSQTREELFVLERNPSRVQVFDAHDGSHQLTHDLPDLSSSTSVTGCDHNSTLYIASNFSIYVFAYTVTEEKKKSLTPAKTPTWTLGWTPKSLYCVGDRVYAVKGRSVHLFDLEGSPIRSVEDFGDYNANVVHSVGDQFLVACDRKMLVFHGETGLYEKGSKWVGERASAMTVFRGRVFVTLPLLQCWE